MSRLQKLWARLKAQATQNLEDQAFEDEIREHVALLEERFRAQGMSPAEAAQAARRQFGNVTVLKEKQRAQRGLLAPQEWWRDACFGMRMLGRRPALNVAMIVALALGIGANTTVFSIVDAVLLRPLPYAHPERLVEVRSRGPAAPDGDAVSYPDFFDWRAQNSTFAHLVSYHDELAVLTGIPQSVQLSGEVVSWDLLPLLGATPELGRGFRPEDEKLGARTVLISHALWVSQFASDPSVVGRTVQLSGEPYTIAGVLPGTFRFPINAPHNSFWITLAHDNDGTPKAQTANRGNHEMGVIGLMKPNVTIARANADLSTIAARLTRQYPETNTKSDSALVTNELASVLGDTRALLLVILAAVALVLLIACGNVGNLLLVRARERQREMALRSALGANRSRLVRQLFVESLMIGLLGGAAGCVLAFVATPLVLRLMAATVPRAADAGVRLPVLLFAFSISVASSLLFGLLPAMTVARGDLLSPLKEAGRGAAGERHLMGTVVIVGQIALGTFLTMGAALLMTSFVHLARNDQGFNPDHLLTFTFETPDSRYRTRRAGFYQQYFEKLRALPGVESAAGSMMLPMVDNSAHISFEDPEHPRPKGQYQSGRLDLISPGYFKTMEIPLLSGRDFTEADTTNSQQVMIVTQDFAAKFFPGENVLGKRLKPGALGENSSPPAWRTIVGVVGNIRTAATVLTPDPMYYLPAKQLPNWCCMYSVLRTHVDPMSLEPQVKSLVSDMDHDIPVTDVLTMRDRIGLQLSQPRFAMLLLSAFAALALLLTLVGLYGVMAYSVSRRTREIGVRMALGASRGTVMGGVLRHAGGLVLLGIGLGAAASLASAPVLHAFLYGTSPQNPVLFAAVCGVIVFTSFLAAFLPARRAIRIDPCVALRYE